MCCCATNTAASRTKTSTTRACVVDLDTLFDAWKSFFPPEADEIQLRKRLHASLKRLEDLKFVVKFDSENEEWEVRKILKARLPLEDLENLRDRLLAAEQGKPA